MHLAGADVEIDTVQGADAGEGLDDPGHGQQRLAHVGCDAGSEGAGRINVTVKGAVGVK